MTRNGRPPRAPVGRRLRQAASIACPYTVNLMLGVVVLLVYVGWRYLGHITFLSP